ncbi:MAG: LysM peptidoglycan-binding domain-containing protein [Elusimicrobia bacterium]|nr:LysM peptidoglycan-binding domain-containing protein [Elusimicrobiota bacterium]
MPSLRPLLLAALAALPAALAAQDALDRGTTLFLAGRLDRAIDFFSGELRQNPADARAKEILGHCLVIKAKDSLREGDPSAAKAAVRQASPIYPDGGELKTLSLLAELEENAPTPGVPLSTSTLSTEADIAAVLDCFFGDGVCAKGGRYAVHIVRKGETMAEIAIEYYGDMNLWEKIWAANPQLSNPHRLEKGMRLLIPLEK